LEIRHHLLPHIHESILLVLLRIHADNEIIDLLDILWTLKNKPLLNIHLILHNLLLLLLLLPLQLLLLLLRIVIEGVVLLVEVLCKLLLLLLLAHLRLLALAVSFLLKLWIVK